jgi:N-formylglutamate amidohydrolase
MKTLRHIPHGSTKIPDEYRDQFPLTDGELNHEILKMTDSHTLALFGSDTDSDVVFPASRLLVDVERFEDDSKEPMAAQGMGVLYSRTHDQKQLRRELSNEEREELLAKYYRPHHELLEQKVDEALDAEGQVLIIDCHSFPSERLPYEIGEEGDRPEICIGTDSFHTPPGLCDIAVKCFADAGYSVEVNLPFAGALTPLKHYGKEQRVKALMIEVRRDLYMDEATGEKNDNFKVVRSIVQMTIENLEPGEQASISPERCNLLLSLTDVQKVRILLGKSEPAVGDVRPIERQFIRSHLNEGETRLLWACM